MAKSYLSNLLTLVFLLALTSRAFSQNIVITAPMSIAGNYPARAAHLFGPALSNLSGELVLVDDGQSIDVNADGNNMGTVTDGCETVLNDVNGKIALIDRGECAFPTKALSAQAAGAIAVIICNNTPATPGLVQYMAGPDPGTLTIPTVMVSYNTCQTIKSELGNGPVMGGTLAATAGENCENALQAVQGLNAAPAATGGSALFNTSVSGIFYKFTPSANGTMSVSSCGTTLDTWAYILADGCGVLTYLNDNDDCDFDNGEYGSTVEAFVTAGTEYIIYWDDRNSVGSNAPFNWTLSMGAPPQVAVSFQVDMQDETVAAEGVKIAINGGGPQDLVDAGNGIWMYTATFAAGDQLDYVYLNGANPENSPNLANCRSLTIGTDPIVLPITCFNSCFACAPPVACPLWVDEDFESYSLGGIVGQSSIWLPWTPPTNPANDAVVSNEQAWEGSQSLKIDEASEDDVLLLLGNRTSGNYILKWKCYVPAGHGAFYSFLKDQNNTANGGLQVEFYPDGTGDIDAGAENNFTFTYPHNEWFEVYHAIDLDNDWIRLWVDGKLVHEWPFSWSTFSQTGLNQLGSVDFYASTDNLYFIDGIQLKEIEACPAGAIICESFDGYDLGDMGGQSPWWTTWTANLPDEYGLVTNEQFLSCEQSLKIAEANGDDQLLLLGLRNSGNYLLAFDMFIPTGSNGYYNILKTAGAAVTNNDFAYAAHFGSDGICTLDIGAPSVASLPYPQGSWFNIVHIYDLDNDVARLYINGVYVGFYPASLTATLGAGAKQIGAVDFYGDVDNLYYVDDIVFLELPPVNGDACVTANDLSAYLGGGQNTTVSTPLFNNSGYVANPTDPVSGWDCFGEPNGTGVVPELNNTIWFTFTGDGNTYTIETGSCGATDYIDDGDTQMAIFEGTCGALSPVDCNENSPNSTIGDNFAGLELATTIGTQYYMMIDGYNLNGTTLSEGEFCINFTQLTAVVPSVEVTFQVDMTWVLDGGGTIEGIKIAGDFADNGANLANWDPPTSPAFTPIGNDVYQTKISFPLANAGGDLKYKFLNTSNTWGDCHIQQECLDNEDAACKDPGSDNRLLVIPSTNQTYCFTWDTCVPCNSPNGTSDEIELAMSIAPNPFSTRTVVSFGETLSHAKGRLTTMTGQLIRSYAIDGSQLTLDKGDLLPGMYFFQVVTANGVSTAKKLVVE